MTHLALLWLSVALIDQDRFRVENLSRFFVLGNREQWNSLSRPETVGKRATRDLSLVQIWREQDGAPLHTKFVLIIIRIGKGHVGNSVRDQIDLVHWVS